jgi:signal transduction histidine kinase
MGAVPSPPDLGSPKDLGFSPSRIAVSVLAAGGAPSALACALGIEPAFAALIGLSAAASAVIAGALLFRHLKKRVMAPLGAMTAALEQLRSSGQAPRLLEQGAPMMQPLLRRFNLAVATVEERQHLSRANLMSVEVAFDRVHSVLQSLREGVVVVDDNGRVVLANRSARQVVRNDSGAIEGRYLTDLLDADLREGIRDAMARIDARSAEEIKISDIVYRDRFFDLTLVQVQSTRPDHDFGKVVVLVDVTRNHELNKLKDDLLSSISHELRTPLTNMCSSSEILSGMDPRQESEWREFVHILNAESHRLKILVDDVMEYSQIETGRTHWTMDKVDVQQLVRNAVEMMTPRAEQKSIQITLTCDGEDFQAAIDGYRITEVACRVIDNAVKFTPDGGRVHIALTARDDMIDVAVADSGVGIQPENWQKVFERFSQIGDIMTEKPKGAGLGLSICQRIVDAMGGTMWCEESPLGGAQIRFVLPRTARLLHH